MRQIEPVATTWQIGLSLSLSLRALNLNTDLGTFIPSKSATVKSVQLKRAPRLFGEGHQTSAVRVRRSAAGEFASTAFWESCLNCAISQPCNFSWSPQCSQCFYVRLQLWHDSLPGTLSKHIHVFSVHALLCCCIGGWSFLHKDMSIIPVVTISAETRWSCSKIPSYLLEDCCHID